MKANNFSNMPSVNISRSKFTRKSQHKTSFNLGEIVPIYVDEVLPGDTRKIDIGSLIRMPSLIAPIMDNIYLDLYAFSCPNRLVYGQWKKFMGENTSGAGIVAPSTNLALPTKDIFTTGIDTGSLGHHMGLPVIGTITGSKHCEVSCMPLRIYKLIYNRFFRDQNLIAPVTVGTGAGISSDNYNVPCFIAAKKSDYFTRALPYAQKGAPVTIPLGTNAPVFWDADSNLDAQDNAVMSLRNQASVPASIGTTFQYDGAQSDLFSLKADLSQATAATINQLRFAFQYQKMLEKDALYGTRYWEIIKAHFGVVAPDQSLQDPEYLGHRRINISINQVTQTTGSNQATPSQNTLGATGAVSVTGDGGNIFTKSFTEHGYIMILAVARHEQTYSQGIERMWTRKDRTDFYWPVFANLGAQSIKNKELFVSGGALDDEVFGFQEAWAEYRYKPSKVSGLLDPAVPNSLGWWTLASNFASIPSLSQSFIEQDRNALGRVLSTGTTGPDFIADFAFIDTAVRPMPLYSVPGLIDHH